MYLIFFKKLNSFHVYKTALDFEQVKQEPLNKCVHMSMQFKFDSRYNPLPLEKNGSIFAKWPGNSPVCRIEIITQNILIQFSIRKIMKLKYFNENAQRKEVRRTDASIPSC